MSRILTIESEEDLNTLRKVSTEVENLNEVKELIISLKEKFNEDESSLGLAAPQLGVNKRVFIMTNPLNNGTVITCINPKIIKEYKDKVAIYKEACLSLPDTYVLTRRYKMLKVSFTTEEGKRETKLLRDEYAVIFQHEYDHLDGIIITDKDLRKINDRERIK